MKDIYDYEKRLERIEANIQGSEKISQPNKSLILRFKEECFANNTYKNP